jgi:hypothetical protein
MHHICGVLDIVQGDHFQSCLAVGIGSVGGPMLCDQCCAGLLAKFDRFYPAVRANRRATYISTT